MIEALATAAEKIAETTGELIEKSAEFAAEAVEKIQEADLDSPISFEDTGQLNDTDGLFKQSDIDTALDLDSPVSDLIEENEQVSKFGLFERKPYEDLSDAEWDTVYDGLEEYDFSETDIFKNPERLDGILTNFTDENWAKLTLEEKKAAMLELEDYVAETLDLKNPPHIEFYNSEVEGEYGYFSEWTNTIGVNEYMLHDNMEAADTIAHELRHTYQHERAVSPQTRMDAMYSEGFKNYISPDMDFEGYQSQLVESEARAFAQQVKNRITELG